MNDLNTFPQGPTIERMMAAFATATMDHCILALDDQGIVTWANPAAGKMLCAEPSDLIGAWFGQCFVAEDLVTGIPQHELNVSRQTGSASDDRWMARLDGSRFWASGVTVHLGAQHGAPSFLKIFRDLTTHQMQFERARIQAANASGQAEEMRDAIAIVSHELRNPLAGIMVALDVAALKPLEWSSSESVFGAISANLDLAVKLVDDLLEHSKVSSQGFRLEPSACTLQELLEASALIARQQMKQQDRFIPVIVPTGDVSIYVDRMRMQQVFVNLIANALRYTPLPGKIWVTGTIEGSEVIVRVTDEGIGIEPHVLDNLFRAFTHVGAAESRLGLGLGLALVKRILEQHGGSVQARSEGKGRGSQFIARFPAAVADTSRGSPLFAQVRQ